MSRVCELSGVRVQSGNNVSHSQRKTRRKFLPNLQNVTLLSDALGLKLSFRVAARTLRTVESGGVDNYLLKINSEKLSKNARSAQKKIKEIMKNKKSA